MTTMESRAPRRPATCPGPRIGSGAGFRAGIPAAVLIGALALAGCSTGHIGESWQCPLAEGGSCDSVAAADPAVPDPKAESGTVLREPLWRVRGGEPGGQPSAPPPARGEPAPASEPGGQACDAECAGGFDPFAWLSRLFAAEAHDGDARPAGRSASESAMAAWPSEPVQGGESDVPAEPDGPLPAEAGPLQDDGAEEDLAARGLRTGEVVARIWIAPFVDADGVYREASHVRAVLAPAGWRLP